MKNLYTRSGRVAVVGVLALLLLSSCVSYDIEQEGVVGTVYDLEGLKILVDAGADAMLAAALRNDNDYELEVSFRAIGGEIGYRATSSTGYASVGGYGGGKVNAAWLASDPTVYLESGEEILVSAFLNNWYYANKNFKSRIEVVIRQPGTPARLIIRADQDDVFFDAKTLFQDNKLGRNDPSRYGSRAGRLGELPRDYELRIPD